LLLLLLLIVLLLPQVALLLLLPLVAQLGKGFARSVQQAVRS
jgi:hypothetical protein